MKKLNILVACAPADGHFKPLTGIARYLTDQGHDVRWYASSKYTPDIEAMGMRHYPFTLAADIHASDMEEHFPERKKIKNPIAKINFDIVHFFVNRAPEYMADIRNVQAEFSIDIVICDLGFSAIPYIQDVLQLPVLSVSVFPFPGSSRGMPPYGFGLTPASNAVQKMRYRLLSWIAKQVLFRKSKNIMHRLMESHQVVHNGADMFNIYVQKSDRVLQSGSPSFDYRRPFDKHVRFAGAILPALACRRTPVCNYPQLDAYSKVVLITQGTVEKDNAKLVIPGLEAFKQEEDTFVICTTGGSDTEILRSRYNSPHILIEDFIPFEDIMPYVDLFISNGGYGGVLQSIRHGVPMLVAGVHEGKNEICARIGYLGYGINLKTETPKAEQIRNAAKEMLRDASYHKKVAALQKEMEQYNPYFEAEDCIYGILAERGLLDTAMVKKYATTALSV
jgi:MGT family glycosyltransferase